MSETEADTCRKYVLPNLYQAGWTDEQINEQHTFTDGRIIPTSKKIRRGPQKRAGAAVPNPGAGGYGVVLRFGAHHKELSGGFRRTTNNRMELMAVIVGLEALKEQCKVALYGDSQYIVNAITSGSALRWRKNGWKFNPAGTKRVKNPDLWERLLVAYERHEVEMIWVKGHAGLADNERCDTLAMAACKLSDLPADPSYVDEVPEQAVSERETQIIAPKGKGKITAEGQPCRHCGTPVVKRVRHRRVSERRSYYFAWTLYCEKCKTVYLVEEAKRYVNRNQERPEEAEAKENHD